jgi:hypothetical protein
MLEDEGIASAVVGGASEPANCSIREAQVLKRGSISGAALPSE